MNKLLSIINELDDTSSDEFIGACAAKLRHLKGVPRLVLSNTSKLKTKHIKFLFAKDENYFTKIDEKYFDLIEEDCVEEFLNEIDCVIVFDLCRMSFLENDELFNFAPNKIKKIFKLNQRNEEKNNFIQSNIKHLDNSKNVTSQVIFEKLNAMWQSKWNNSETYLNEYDEQIINNILNV